MQVKQVPSTDVRFHFAIECNLQELLRIYNTIESAYPTYSELRSINNDILNAIKPVLDATYKEMEVK